MPVNSIRARQQLRNAQHVDHWMAELLALLKSDSANKIFDMFGVTRQSSPTGFTSELSASIHLKNVITQREHVLHNSESGPIVYGRLRLRELIDGKPAGQSYVSVIVRADGFLSFDGTIDMRFQMGEVHGYEEQICHAFAEAALMAVYQTLETIG